MICYTNKHKIPFQIDEEDFERVKLFTWNVNNKGYIVAKNIGLLHIFLYGYAPIGLEWDHINGDKKDCRRKKMRQVTHQFNMLNKGARCNSLTGYPGVNPTAKGFRAAIMINGKGIRLGNFDTLEEAIIVRKAAELKYYGLIRELYFELI